MCVITLPWFPCGWAQSPAVGAGFGVRFPFRWFPSCLHRRFAEKQSERSPNGRTEAFTRARLRAPPWCLGHRGAASLSVRTLVRRHHPSDGWLFSRVTIKNPPKLKLLLPPFEAAANPYTDSHSSCLLWQVRCPRAHTRSYNYIFFFFAVIKLCL